jgi:hypothetical protein
LPEIIERYDVRAEFKRKMEYRRQPIQQQQQQQLFDPQQVEFQPNQLPNTIRIIQLENNQTIRKPVQQKFEYTSKLYKLYKSENGSFDLEEIKTSKEKYL